METFLAIASRREVRDYERRPIPSDVERRILDAGRLAGNASNRQPWLLRLARCLAKLVVVPNDERSEMTPALRSHLEGLGERGRAKVARDSVESLRFSWPHRHTLRGRSVVCSNVTMLRNLREWS